LNENDDEITNEELKSSTVPGKCSSKEPTHIEVFQIKVEDDDFDDDESDTVDGGIVRL